jgi:hypothetical protein
LQEWLASNGAIRYTAPSSSEHGDDHRVGYRSRIYRGNDSNMDDDDC